MGNHFGVSVWLEKRFFTVLLELFTEMILVAGEAVAVEDEVVVVNCIVLPHKNLNLSVQDEIIL